MMLRHPVAGGRLRRYGRSVLGYCWRTWRQRPLAWLATVLAVGALLSAAAGVQLLVTLAQRSLGQQVSSASEIQVFLNDRDQPDQVTELKATLEKVPGVRSVEYRSKEQALALARSDGQLEALAQSAGGNPFPASLVVHTSSPAVATRVAAIARASAAADPQVPTSFTAEEGRKLASALRIAQISAWVLSAGALGLATLVGLVLMRSELRTHRAELAILGLLGTPRTVIRLPVMAEAVSVALVGSALAALSLLLIVHQVVPVLNSALPFLQLAYSGSTGNQIALLTVGASVAVLGASSACLRLPR